MSSNPAGGAQHSRGRPSGRWFPLALALVALIAVPGRATAEDVTPFVSPDRVDDVPSTKPDPFPAFDNFAWRAFVALNWPSLLDPAHRGSPTGRKRWAIQARGSGRHSRPAMNCSRLVRTVARSRRPPGRVTTGATPAVPAPTIG